MNLLQSVILFTLYLSLMPPVLLPMNKYYTDCLLLSFPFQQHAPKKFVLTKERKKEKQGRLIQLFFCTLGSISHQLLIGHGSWHDRQKCHNKWGYCTIKKHAHLNWVPKWTFGCPSLSLVDLLLGFCMCGVGDKQRAKQREEHFYCNHNCTHTHTLVTNICTTDTANVCQ